MHSHDRTLLAKLGFADPDKKNSLHDLACQYLVEDEQARKLIARLDPKALTTPIDGHGDCCYAGVGYHREGPCTEACGLGLSFEKAAEHHLPRTRIESSNFALEITRAELERILSKGRGQYKTTIGFVDAMISYAYTARVTTERTIYRRPDNCCGQVSSGPNSTHVTKNAVDGTRLHSGSIGVEVKIAPCGSGEVLRQVKLYREHIEPEMYGTTWVAAVAFDVATDFVESLKRENIQTIRLGSAFSGWVERRMLAAKSACVDEV